MIRIRTMTVRDVPLGMRLKEQAGWNQTEADWRRVLALEPEGCFVAEMAGRRVGTTATSVFDSVGWLSLVLVDASVRGRGVGTQLLQHALDYLEGRRVVTVRLDATPLGRPIYERLGFVAEYELARFTGTVVGGESSVAVVSDAAQSTETSAIVVPAGAEHLEAIVELDRGATGTNRRPLIERMWQERPHAMRIAVDRGQVAGYAWLHPGSQFMHVGPVVAQDAWAGRALLAALLQSFPTCAADPILLDVPVDNRPAMLWAESHNLREQRRLTRMRRGGAVHDRPEQLWAGFGPEKG